MSSLEQLQETVKVQGLTLEAVAHHATTEEELRRGVREVLAALEAWARRLEGILAEKPAANLIEFRKN